MSKAHKFYGNFLLCVFKFSVSRKKQTTPPAIAVDSIFGLKFEFFSLPSCESRIESFSYGRLQSSVKNMEIGEAVKELNALLKYGRWVYETSRLQRVIIIT